MSVSILTFFLIRELHGSDVFDADSDSDNLADLAILIILLLPDIDFEFNEQNVKKSSAIMTVSLFLLFCAVVL